MPRTADPSKRIMHPSYRWAWLFVRGDVYYTSIHSQQIKSTGIVVSKKNLKQALDILDKRLREYQNPELKDKPKVPTITEAVKEFIATRHGKVAPRTIAQYLGIYEQYLPFELDANDTNAIRSAIVEKLAASKVNSTTKNGHMKKLRALFAYCVEVGLCEKNPVAKSMVPGIVKAEVKAFTQQEIDAIIKQLRSGGSYTKHPREREELILLIRLLATTGMRIAEALKLTKDDLLPDGIRIDGKRESFNKPKIRYFPFALIPEVRSICEELKAFSPSNPSSKLFTWQNRTNPADNLKQAMIALGIDHNRKSMHSLRKTALNRWEKELGLPAEIRNMLAGHTSAVKSNYYREHTLEDTISTIAGLKDFALRV
jgi:integrase